MWTLYVFLLSGSSMFTVGLTYDECMAELQRSTALLLSTDPPTPHLSYCVPERGATAKGGVR